MTYSGMCRRRIISVPVDTSVPLPSLKTAGTLDSPSSTDQGRQVLFDSFSRPFLTQTDTGFGGDLREGSKGPRGSVSTDHVTHLTVVSTLNPCFHRIFTSGLT